MTDSSKIIRWGVAGCGQIAVDKTIPGVLAAKGARLVAIADPLVPRRELALGLASAAGLNDIRVYDYDVEMFQDPNIDAVYIAMPTGLHAGAVIAAAKAKKAILCEKPMGNSAIEVREMVHAARHNNVPLMTAYMSRFSDVFQKTTQLVHEGVIGKVTFVTAHFSYPCFKYYPPNAAGGWRYTDPIGGGPLLDIGVYLSFGLREMLGERVAQVSPLNTNTFPPKGSAIADTTAAWFITDKGTPGTLITSFSHVGLYMNFFGTKGNITVSDLFYQRPGARLEVKSEDMNYVLDTTTDPNLTHFDNYRREFEHFSYALLNGTPHRPSADDVLEDALLLDTLKQNAPASAIHVVPTAKDFLQSR
jgi:D-xylose 1-dehydrogenase (NADP+, D-xylono-1,5-lactone-forming)